MALSDDEARQLIRDTVKLHMTEHRRARYDRYREEFAEPEPGEGDPPPPKKKQDDTDPPKPKAKKSLWWGDWNGDTDADA